MIEIPVETITPNNIPIFLSYFKALLVQRQEDYKTFGESKEDTIFDQILNYKIQFLENLYV